MDAERQEDELFRKKLEALLKKMREENHAINGLMKKMNQIHPDDEKNSQKKRPNKSHDKL